MCVCVLKRIDRLYRCTKIFATEAKLRQSWAKLLQQLETFHGQGKIFLGEHTAQLLVEPLTDPPGDQNYQETRQKKAR